MLNGAIYVIGGLQGSTYYRDVWKSTDGGQSWVEIAKTGTKFSARAFHSSAVLGNAIYVIGGNSPVGGVGNFLNDVWKSTDNGETWVDMSATGLLQIQTHSSVALDGALYVMGGAAAAAGLQNNVWKSTDGGKTWANVATTQFNDRAYHSSVVAGSDIYTIGGSSSLTLGSLRDDVWKSDNAGVTWNQVTTSGTRFSARFGHSSVGIDNAIYVIGGSPGTSNRSDEVWKSENNGVNWAQVATGTRFSARTFHSSVVLGKDIYVIGGLASGSNNNLNDVWKSTDGGVTWKNVHTP